MGIYGHEKFTEEQLESLEKENSFCACLVSMKPQRLHRDRSFATEIDVFTTEIYLQKPVWWKWCYTLKRKFWMPWRK